MSNLRGHGVRTAHVLTAGPRTDAPPAPSGGTKEHGTPKPVADEDWRSRGACAGKPNVWFFADEHNFGALLYKDARALCHRCPVRITCLNYALDNDERHGLWGGASPNERKRMLRERDKKPTAEQLRARSILLAATGSVRVSTQGGQEA